MPELPDVEGYRVALAEHLIGWRIQDVTVLDAGILRNVEPNSFRRRLRGHRFEQPDRRGKWLLLPTDGPILVLHNGMTGHPYLNLASTSADGRSDPYDRLVISCDGGELRYADLRKLRGLWLADDSDAVRSIIGRQGPDALGLSASEFRSALRGRRGAVKTVLMNQQVIAGLGNMLSDELCWRARINPARTVTELNDAELTDLHRALRQCLRIAVRYGHIPRTRAWLNSARSDDQAPCPRCGSRLRREDIGGRTSIWCPRCQPAPHPG